MNAIKWALCVAMLIVCLMPWRVEAQQQCAPGRCSTTTFEVVLVVAKSCRFVSSTDVSFGNTTVAPGQILEAFGSLRVRCNDSVAYQISLDQGLHGSGPNDRKMALAGCDPANPTNCTDTIAYQLYSGSAGTNSCNAAAGVQWSNATTGCLYRDSYAGTEQDIQIHGKLTMGNPRAGSYSDTITATITY